jgi:hypothetical protein
LQKKSLNLIYSAFAQTPASHRLYSDDSNNNKLSWLPASIKTEISAAIINDVFKSVQTVARLKQVIDQLISLKMAPTKEMVDKMFEVLLPAGNRLTLVSTLPPPNVLYLPYLGIGD